MKILKILCDTLKATIKVNSNEDNGTLFELKIPLKIQLEGR